MTNADTVKHIIEAIGTTVAAIVTVATWFAGMLPPLAALASIMWVGYQFYHSPPVVDWRNKRRAKKGRKNGKLN